METNKVKRRFLILKYNTIFNGRSDATRGVDISRSMVFDDRRLFFGDDRSPSHLLAKLTSTNV
jgi:hypothetical protein